METIITNNYNLKEEEMTESVKRVKVLLVNYNDEILLGYSNHEYQFPGGHVEDGEDLQETVVREIKEETGINLAITDNQPFACAIGYYKDWPKIGCNRKIEIYYYEIKTDEKPRLDNLNLTEKEKEGNFELRYIKLSEIEDELKSNAEKYGDPHGIAKEMLELLDIYDNYKNSKTYLKK